MTKKIIKTKENIKRVKNTFDIMVLGVGGQGIISVGHFFQEYALQDAEIINMVATESRGVSQREGSVTSIIRYQIPSQNSNLSGSFLPIPSIQGIDLLIALEPLEFIRNIQFIAPNGAVIVNTQPLIPKNTITSSDHPYPEIQTIIDLIQSNYPQVQLVAKNFSEEALNVADKSIFANILMCKEAVKLCPSIFNEDLFENLLNTYFNIKT